MRQCSALAVSVCAALLLALGACPAPRGRIVLPKQPDPWAQSIQLEDAFYAELQRLQRLYTDEPDLALASPKGYDGKYTLSSCIEDKRAGLVLAGRFTHEQWTLWFYDGSVTDDSTTEATQPPGSNGESAPERPAISDTFKMEVLRDEAVAGGYAVELALDQGELAITVTARWVQGRYLQCTRELTLGGMDIAKQAGIGQAQWTLEGRWLPYRMVPGVTGPYGVVADAEADGNWCSRGYPLDALVPAVAAYDRTHGFLLAVADDHPRKLDRRYDLDYSIPQSRAPGAQLRLGYSVYDGTRDVFDPPLLVSGLPVRDSIVLEPLELTSKSTDWTLVEAETAEVIRHVADFVHAYHFIPRPPAQPEPGAIVEAAQLAELAAGVGKPGSMADGIAVAAGPVGAKFCIFDPWPFLPENDATQQPRSGPAKLPALFGIGIDNFGAAGGQGLGEKQLEQVRLLKQNGLQVLVASNTRSFSSAEGLPVIQPQWFIDQSGMLLSDRLKQVEHGKDKNHPLELQPEWREPQALTWFVSKLTDDLKRYPDVAGYLVELPQPVVTTGPAAPAVPHTASYDAYNAIYAMRLGEVLRTNRGDAALFCDSMPSLGLPAWCAVLEPGGLLTGDADTLSFNVPSSVSAGRLVSYAVNSVFGVKPYIQATGTLGGAVLRCVGDIGGYQVDTSLGGLAGFAGFATHQPELAGAAGELRVLYADPAVNNYTGGSERPAQLDKLVAVLPGRWEGAHAIWVSFIGVGGSVAVDKYNQITVQWNGGMWKGKLPVGYWEITHAAKGHAVQPNDAVLLLLKPIGPGSTAERPLG